MREELATSDQRVVKPGNCSPEYLRDKLFQRGFYCSQEVRKLQWSRLRLVFRLTLDTRTAAINQSTCSEDFKVEENVIQTSWCEPKGVSMLQPKCLSYCWTASETLLQPKLSLDLGGCVQHLHQGFEILYQARFLHLLHNYFCDFLCVQQSATL